MTTTDQARIKIAEPDTLRNLEAEASPALKHLFDLMKKGVEAIPGVPAEALYSAVTLRALAVKPEIFKSWFEAEYFTLKQGEVPAKIKELLAMAVSRLNEEDVCVSCTPYHAGAARFEGASEAEIEAIANDESLPEPTRQVINFGLKATFRPKEVTDADVEEIKKLGYSDGAIVEIVSSGLIAYNLSALNRIFNLKIE